MQTEYTPWVIVLKSHFLLNWKIKTQLTSVNVATSVLLSSIQFFGSAIMLEDVMAAFKRRVRYI